MLNAVVTRQHCKLAPGQPNVFLTDEKFMELFTNPELAKSVWEFFGNNVCVGRLGREENGVFVEDSYQVPSFQGGGKEVLGFYERVFQDV